MVSVANEESDEGPATFFVYTGVGTQSVVFKRKWEEISPPEQEENDESDSLSEQNASKTSIENDSGIKDNKSMFDSMKKANIGEQIASLEAEDMIRKIDEEVKQESQNDAVQFNR